MQRPFRPALLAAASLLFAGAGPALAEVTAKLCQDAASAAVQTFGMFISPDLGSAVDHGLAPDGWCRLWSTEETDSAVIDWHLPNLEAVVAGTAPFTGLELRTDRFDGGDGNGPVREITASVVYDAEARVLTVPDLVMVEGALWQITASAALGGVDLSSQTALQLSLGGVQVKSLQIAEETETPQSRRPLQDIAMFLAGLTTRTTDPFTAQQRAALGDYLIAENKTAGRLRLSYDSDAGLGMLTLISNLDKLVGSGDVDLSIFLDGAELDITWEPLR